jgi:hypothetical protein
LNRSPWRTPRTCSAVTNHWNKARSSPATNFSTPTLSSRPPAAPYAVSAHNLPGAVTNYLYPHLPRVNGLRTATQATALPVGFQKSAYTSNLL